MPLSDNLPVIDDRRYGDILEELRTRIPRYTPEWQGWTDLNDSDPGITISQLLAWLTDMMIHRMSKVPALNYIKFLELIGVELRPAQPALAEIEFPVLPDHSRSYAIVPSRTQVSAEAEDGGAPIVFETDTAIYALTAQLRFVQVFNGLNYLDASEDNRNLGGFLPFGNTAKVGSAMYLGFAYTAEYPGPQEFPRIDLDLTVMVDLEPGTGAAFYRCVDSRRREFPSARIAWESWNGADWQSLDLVVDETLALTRSGHIVLRTPDPGVLQPVKVGDLGARQEGYFVRARLMTSAYERVPTIRGVRANTVRATQAETVTDEVLGGSNGMREQVFTLESRPVLLNSLRLEIDEGDGLQPWTRVDDFFSSAVDDTHYVLNATTGEVRLGGVRFDDNLHGHVPVANPSNPNSNVVAREYRFGGGKRGNVKGRTLTTLVTSVEGIDDGNVTNLSPAYSGREEETLDEARNRASRSLRSRSRAVSVDDFEQLAQEAANVKRAKALPLYHPNFPETPIPGVVSVIVVPDSDSAQPTPSEGTLRTVCAYLDERRLLTSEVFVLKPTYQRVEVRADIILLDDADLLKVKTAIEEELSRYFHPLNGGDDGLGWPFGGRIFFSKVVNRVFRIAGVASIESLEILLDDDPKEKCADVDLKPNALTYSTKHQMSVHYDFGEESL